jgi:hypothetical protein
MPVIKYRFNQGLAVLDCLSLTKKKVEVYGRGANLKSLIWLGYVCMHGLKTLGDGGYVKMQAALISNGDGNFEDEWRELKRDETILCWWSKLHEYGTVAYGVYTIVDDDGWPIITSLKGTDPEELFMIMMQAKVGKD